MTASERSAKRPGFWRFSTAIYGQDGVKAACLSLQAAGIDVNVALFVVWAIVTGRDPAPVLGEVLNRSALWRASVVQPLRTARDGLKPAPDFVEPEAAAALRKTILQAELEGERLQQVALEPLAALCGRFEGPGRRALARCHLGDCAQRCAAGAGADAAIAAFVETVFSSLENV